MRVKIAQIGNSKGVRIPKYILTECNISEEAELEVSNGRIVITNPPEVRSGWHEAALNNKDVLGAFWEW